MPAIEHHPPGAFCWTELGTTDPDAAKTFYSAIFGWTPEDLPMPSGAFTMLRLGGRELGALYRLPNAQLEMGVPPHWLNYVAVPDVAATIDRVRSLGGTLLMGPHEVPGAGSMAVFRDPQGAVFAVWQAQGQIGARVQNEDGAVCWTELATTDAGAARSFYTALFGWTTTYDDKGRYTEWKNGDSAIGGMIEMTEEWGGAPPYWMPYFLVADCDATAAQAKQAGGSALVEPKEIPGVGRFAVLADPQGAVFSVIRLDSA